MKGSTSYGMVLLLTMYVHLGESTDLEAVCSMLGIVKAKNRSSRLTKSHKEIPVHCKVENKNRKKQ